jgi:hypothetical protein
MKKSNFLGMTLFKLLQLIACLLVVKSLTLKLRI